MTTGATDAPDWSPPADVTNYVAAADDSNKRFHWADYFVFSLSLGIPLAIGVFFLFYKRNEQTTESFLTGEKSVNFVAVGLSLLASLINGALIIGFPAEIHYYGMAAVYLVPGIGLAVVATAHVFVPTYHAMSFTSAYEYVERRYNKATRIIASAVFILSVIIFLGVVLYVPSFAFSQVTDLSLEVTIVIMGVICTVYTAMGGLKAVVWTNAIQMIILLVGLVIIAALGASKVGGGAYIWKVANQGQRLNFNSFSLNPTVRVTVWTQLLGQGVVFLGLLISNQMLVQRFMAVATTTKAQLSLYIAFAGLILLAILICFIGLVIHATYFQCDPIVAGNILRGDQIFPYYVMDLLGDYHGIPGLITASIFAAALSSVSAVINALSAVCLEDFIDPAVMKFRKKKLDDATRKRIAIGIVIFFGALTIGLSFAADKVTDKLVEATGIIWGVIGGPLAGIFIMGFFMPWCNSWGAISGMFGGLCLAFWVSIGNILYAPDIPTLPIGICINNLTIIGNPRDPNIIYSTVDEIYQVSYGWYGVIGTGSCIIIGVLVSIITGGCSKEHRSGISPSLMYSAADNCCCCCPASCVRCYRCGVDYDAAETISNKDTDTKDLGCLDGHVNSNGKGHAGHHENGGYVDENFLNDKLSQSVYENTMF